MAAWARRAAPALLLALFTLLFWQPLAFSSDILARGDTYNFFYPFWDARSAAFQAGHLPLWTPDLFMGAPLLADPQVGTFYPPNWLLAWLPTVDALRLAILLHVFWAGLGAYALFRRLHDASAAFSWGGIAAGLTFAGGGVLSAHAEQINQVQGLSWLPWLVLFFWHVLEGKQGRDVVRAGLLLAAALALQLFSGHTQTSFMSVCALGLFGAGWVLRHRSYDWAGLGLGVLLSLAAIGVAALLLALPQVLPTLELTGLSNRGGDGLNAAQATAFSLPPTYLGRALLPGYDGLLFTEYLASIGLLGLGLAVLGAWDRRGEYRLVWMAFVLLGILLALGRYNPLYFTVLAELPGFNLFRVPARWLALSALGLALLAGLGVQSLPYLRLRLGQIARLCLPVLPLIALALLVKPDAADVIGPAQLSPRSFIAWGLAGTVLLLLFWRAPLPQRLMPLVAGLLALELVAAGRILPGHDLVPRDLYEGQRFSISQMRAWEKRDETPGRLLAISALNFDPGDRAALEARFARAGLSERAQHSAFVAVKRQETIFPNLPLTWGIASVDGFGGGLLPSSAYTQFTALWLPPGQVRSVDGRLGEALARPECNGACLPDSALLRLGGVEFLLLDKVYDRWLEGVAYDTAFAVPLENDSFSRWDSLPPFQSTALHLLYVGEVPPRPQLVMVDGARLTLDAPQISALDEFTLAVYALPQPLDVAGVELRGTGTLHAVTLVDARVELFQQLAPQDWPRVLSSDIKIYRNEAHQRAWLASSAVLAEDSWQGNEDALALLRENPARVVLHSAALPPLGDPGPEARLRFIEDGAERVEIEVSSEQPALLLLADAHYPGWRAELDGQPATLYRANVMFRAVAVPAGTSRVAFVFAPELWQVAGIAGLLAWALGLALFLYVSGRPSSKKAATSPPAEKAGGRGRRRR